jgi:hypothetical protein
MRRLVIPPLRRRTFTALTTVMVVTMVSNANGASWQLISQDIIQEGAGKPTKKPRRCAECGFETGRHGPIVCHASQSVRASATECYTCKRRFHKRKDCDQ